MLKSEIRRGIFVFAGAVLAAVMIPRAVGLVVIMTTDLSRPGVMPWQFYTILFDVVLVAVAGAIVARFTRWGLLGAALAGIAVSLLELAIVRQEMAGAFVLAPSSETWFDTIRAMCIPAVLSALYALAGGVIALSWRRRANN